MRHNQDELSVITDISVVPQDNCVTSVPFSISNWNLQNDLRIWSTHKGKYLTIICLFLSGQIEVNTGQQVSENPSGDWKSQHINFQSIWPRKNRLEANLVEHNIDITIGWCGHAVMHWWPRHWRTILGKTTIFTRYKKRVTSISEWFKAFSTLTFVYIQKPIWEGLATDLLTNMAELSQRMNWIEDEQFGGIAQLPWRQYLGWLWTKLSTTKSCARGLSLPCSPPPSGPLLSIPNANLSGASTRKNFYTQAGCIPTRFCLVFRMHV